MIWSLLVIIFGGAGFVNPQPTDLQSTENELKTISTSIHNVSNGDHNQSAYQLADNIEADLKNEITQKLLHSESVGSGPEIANITDIITDPNNKSRSVIVVVVTNTFPLPNDEAKKKPNKSSVNVHHPDESETQAKNDIDTGTVTPGKNPFQKITSYLSDAFGFGNVMKAANSNLETDNTENVDESSDRISNEQQIDNIEFPEESLEEVDVNSPSVPDSDQSFPEGNYQPNGIQFHLNPQHEMNQPTPLNIDVANLAQKATETQIFESSFAEVSTPQAVLPNSETAEQNQMNQKQATIESLKDGKSVVDATSNGKPLQNQENDHKNSLQTDVLQSSAFSVSEASVSEAVTRLEYNDPKNVERKHAIKVSVEPVKDEVRLLNVSEVQVKQTEENSNKEKLEVSRKDPFIEDEFQWHENIVAPSIHDRFSPTPKTDSFESSLEEQENVQIKINNISSSNSRSDTRELDGSQAQNSNTNFVILDSAQQSQNNKKISEIISNEAVANNIDSQITSKSQKEHRLPFATILPPTIAQLVRPLTADEDHDNPITDFSETQPLKNEHPQINSMDSNMDESSVNSSTISSDSPIESQLKSSNNKTVLTAYDHLDDFTGINEIPPSYEVIDNLVKAAGDELNDPNKVNPDSKLNLIHLQDSHDNASINLNEFEAMTKEAEVKLSRNSSRGDNEEFEAPLLEHDSREMGESVNEVNANASHLEKSERTEILSKVDLLTADDKFEKVLTNNEEALQENILLTSSNFDQQASLKATAVNSENVPFSNIQPEVITMKEKMQENELSSNSNNLNSRKVTLKNDLLTSRKEVAKATNDSLNEIIHEKSQSIENMSEVVEAREALNINQDLMLSSDISENLSTKKSKEADSKLNRLEAADEKTEEVTRAELNSIDEPKGSELNEILPMNDVAAKELESDSHHKADLQAAKEARIINVNVVENFEDLSINERVLKVEKVSDEDVTIADGNVVDHEKDRNGDSLMKEKVDSNQGVAESNINLLETDNEKADNLVLNDIPLSESFSSVPVKDAEATLDTESIQNNWNLVQLAEWQATGNANDKADIESNEAYPDDDLLAVESGSILASLQSAPDNNLNTTSSENNLSLQVSNSELNSSEIKINPVSIAAAANDESTPIKSEVTSPEVIVENAEASFQGDDKSAVLLSESSGAVLPQDFHSHPIHDEHKENDKDSALLQELIHSKDFTGPLADSKSLNVQQNYNTPEIKNHKDEVAAEAKGKEANAENLYRNNEEIRIRTNDENIQMAESIQNNEGSDHVTALREETDAVSITSGKSDLLTETKQSEKNLISEAKEGDYSNPVVNAKSTNADTNNDNEVHGKQDDINRSVEKVAGAPSDSIILVKESVPFGEGDSIFDSRSNPLFGVQKLEKKFILGSQKDDVFQNNAVQPDSTTKEKFKNTEVTGQNLSVDEEQISMKTNPNVDSPYSISVLTDKINQVPDKSLTVQDDQGIEMKLSTKKQTKVPSNMVQISASVRNNQQENTEGIDHDAKTGGVSHPSSLPPIVIDELHAKGNAAIQITKESAESRDSVKNNITSYPILSKNNSEAAVHAGGEDTTITAGDLKHGRTGESQIENITPAVNSFDQVSTYEDSSNLVLLGNFHSIQNPATDIKINKADPAPLTASASKPTPFSFRDNSNSENSSANPSNFVTENKQDLVKTITISEKSGQNFMTSETNDRNANSTSDLQTIPLEKEIKGIEVLHTSTVVDIKGPGKEALTAFNVRHKTNIVEAGNFSNRNQQIDADVFQENIMNMTNAVELQNASVKIIETTQNSSSMESKTVHKNTSIHSSIENSKSSSDYVDKESEIISIVGKTDQENSLDTKQYLEKNKERSSNRLATEASSCHCSAVTKDATGHDPNLNKPVAGREIFSHDIDGEANPKDESLTKNLKELNENASATVEDIEPALEDSSKIPPKQTDTVNTNLKEENILASKIESDPENNEVRKVKDSEGNSDDSTEDESRENTEHNGKEDKSREINLVELEKSNEGSQEAIEVDDNGDSDQDKKIPSKGEKRKAKELYLPDLSEISNNGAESSEENNDHIDTNPKSTAVLQRRSMMEQLFPLSNVLQLENSTPSKENLDSLDTKFDNGDLHTVVKRPGAHSRTHDTTTIPPDDLKKNIEIMKPLNNQIINASKANTDPTSNVKTIRDLIDLKLVKSNLVADSPSTSTNQESSRQHGAPSTLTGILSLSLSLSLLTILILSSFLIYYLKLRNHHGILNIEMIEQQATPN